MLVSTTGTLKPIRVTFHSIGGKKSVNWSVPVIFPFASIVLYILNVRVLIAPIQPSWMLVVKVALKQILTCLTNFNFKSFIRISVIHLIFIPKEFEDEQITKIEADTHIVDSWVSRFVQIRGIAAHSFSTNHEDDFRITFSKSRLHLLWTNDYDKAAKYDHLIDLKSQISLARVSEINLLKDREIDFIAFENSEIIHGNYVIQGKSFIRNIPYEISEFNTFPQSNLIVNDGEIFSQSVSYSFEVDEALFIGSSTNWYHFLVEILPRGIIWHNNGGKKVPIVFHKPIPETIRRILSSVSGVEPVLVGDGESVFVKSLTVALDGRFGAQPDMLTIAPGKNIFVDRVFDFELIANWLKKSFPLKSLDYPPKVFLARGKDSLRPMGNFDEVEEFLGGLGFVTVFPEKLSLEDQIGLFSNVESLIAEGGAALTGLIFAEKLKSLIHIEANPNFFVANFWQQFSESLNLNAHACLGKPEHIFGYPTGRFSVDLEDLRTKLNGF